MLNAKCFVLFLLATFSAAAEQDSRWSIAAECQMVVLPQKLALPLISELNDETKIEAAFAKIQEFVAKGEATLVANMVAKGRSGEKMVSETVEELRYATEFDPPQLPPNAPENLEVLKAWPAVGITPTGFDTRNVGTTFEIKATALKDGKSIEVATTPQHVRFLRWAKTDAGKLADGKPLFVEQPIFHSTRSMSTLTIRNGQRVLLGVHKLPEPADTIELFLLKVSASLAP